MKKSISMATKPMKQAVIAPSMLALLYPLEEEVPGYSREQSHFYVATGCLETHPFETNPEEPMELLRIPRGDLPSLIRPGRSPIRNAQTLLALNWFVRLEGHLLG